MVKQMMPIMATKPQDQAVEPHTEQRPFWLTHEKDAPIHKYALGIETDTGALVVWLDPRTGHNRFGSFLSAGHTLLQLQQELGPYAPLILVWDERPIEDDIPCREEEIVLNKAKIEQRH
jgi:hypothetical protein